MATLMKKKSKVFLTTWLFSIFLCSVALAESPSGDNGTKDGTDTASYQVSSIVWEQSEDNFIIRIKGDTTPTYTMYELYEPLRVIIDIADATLDNTVSLPIDLPQGPVSMINGKVLEDKEPYITRIELLLTEDQGYKVDRDGNDIIVKFPKTAGEQAITSSNDNEAAQSPDIGSPTAVITASDEPVLSEEVTLPDNNLMAEEVTTVDLSVSEKERATVVTDIEISHNNNETEVYLKADGPIKDYTKVQLGKNLEANRPDRMYLDIKNIRLQRSYLKPKM